MMTNDDPTLTVGCPTCGGNSEKQVSELVETGAFRCSCGAFVTADLNELREFIRYRAGLPFSVLALHAVP